MHFAWVTGWPTSKSIHWHQPTGPFCTCASASGHKCVPTRFSVFVIIAIYLRDHMRANSINDPLNVTRWLMQWNGIYTCIVSPIVSQRYHIHRRPAPSISSAEQLRNERSRMQLRKPQLPNKIDFCALRSTTRRWCSWLSNTHTHIHTTHSTPTRTTDVGNNCTWFAAFLHDFEQIYAYSRAGVAVLICCCCCCG